MAFLYLGWRNGKPAPARATAGSFCGQCEKTAQKNPHAAGAGVGMNVGRCAADAARAAAVSPRAVDYRTVLRCVLLVVGGGGVCAQLRCGCRACCQWLPGSLFWSSFMLVCWRRCAPQMCIPSLAAFYTTRLPRPQPPRLLRLHMPDFSHTTNSNAASPATYAGGTIYTQRFHRTSRGFSAPPTTATTWAMCAASSTLNSTRLPRMGIRRIPSPHSGADE